MKILNDRMLRIEGSAEYSRCTTVHVCADRSSRSADKQLHNNAPHRKCLRKKTTVCVSLFVFFTVRRVRSRTAAESVCGQDVNQSLSQPTEYIPLTVHNAHELTKLQATSYVGVR